MNAMTELETHLRSWAPRKPSATLKTRILAQAAAAAEFGVEPAGGFRLSWLAPAGFALLLCCMLVGQRIIPDFSESPPSGPKLAAIMSNQNAAAYLPGSFQPEKNRFLAGTFEWTNGGHFTSSIGSFSAHRGTNIDE